MKTQDIIEITLLAALLITVIYAQIQGKYINTKIQAYCPLTNTMYTLQNGQWTSINQPTNNTNITRIQWTPNNT